MNVVNDYAMVLEFSAVPGGPFQADHFMLDVGRVCREAVQDRFRSTGGESVDHMKDAQMSTHLSFLQ